MRLVIRRNCVLFLLPVAALGLGGCSKPEAGGSPARATAEAAVPVDVATAVKQDVPVQIRAIARVEAFSTVSIKPQVAGQLTAVHFKEGQDVKTGDRLFSLDARPFQAALDQAEANLARDTAQAEYAAADFARETDLYQRKVAGQLEFEQSKANAAATAATVRADQAAVVQARIDLDYCSIRSPIDGRTGALLVYPGNVVKANEVALVVINQVHPIHVTFSVPEQNLAEIRKCQAEGPLAVEGVIPQDEGPPERGELSFIDNQVDPLTGTITLKGTFQNVSGRLWPGQFVNVLLRLRTLLGAVVVPTAAIQTGQSGQFVFVVKQDQTADLRPIVPGLALDHRTVIRQGIEPGETVVTDGQLRLVPGAKVSIKERAAPTTQEARS
jgi:multidrug efflux system membrane fusion protein